MADVFISYARSTARQAHAAAEALSSLGYSIWMDDALPAHRTFTAVIQEELDAAKAALVIWSTDAVASEWVLSEANGAREDRKLVQARVDGSRLPMPFDQIQCVDLSGWSGDDRHPGWVRVTASIADVVNREVHATESSTHPQPSFSRKSRAAPWAWAVAVLMVLTVVASSAWLLRDHLGPPVLHERVAVLPFDAPVGDVRARDFAAGLTEQIRSVLTANRQQAIARTEAEALRGADRDQAIRRLGVGLLLDGVVESDGALLRVHIHLDDARNHVTLWSKDFEGPADKLAALQSSVAAASTDIADWALISRRSAKTPLDAPTMIAILKGNDLLTNPATGAELEEARAVFREVTRRAPDFALGHGWLAVALAERGLSANSEARRAANRAITLDPHAAGAYLALAEMEPRGHWREREALILKAIAADPEHSFSNLFEGRLLFATGRLAEALPYVRRSVAQRALFPGGNATLGALLVLTGDVDGGRRTLDHAAELWPSNLRVQIDRLLATLALNDWDSADALVARSETRPIFISASEALSWRAALRARKTNDAADMRRAAASVRQSADTRALSASNALYLCAVLGDLDCAFAEADRYFADPASDSMYLFLGGMQSMRRDPRFMTLAASLGLVDYWRSTNHWPDFCAEPGLPYDCKAEAARLAKAQLVNVR